ncbi:hypothetical protein CRYUN_Cryun08bG0023700 [Craigia yunnanensis]
MDTPDKTQITPTPSISNFEDSPVFKYIDSLSPIELAKSRQTDNVFNSLAFLTLHLCFLPRRPVVIGNPGFQLKASNSRVLQSGNESNTSEGASKSVKQSDLYDKHLGCLNNGSSSKGISSDLLDEQSEFANELPRTLKYDCGSPDGNLETYDEILKNTSVEVAGQERSPFQHNRDEWEERQQSFENERDLCKIRQIKLSEESAGCDWVAIVSDIADLLTINSSIIHENTDGQDRRTADSGKNSFRSTILQFPLDNSNNLENAESGDPGGSCKQSELGEPVTDQTTSILSTEQTSSQ